MIAHWPLCTLVSVLAFAACLSAVCLSQRRLIQALVLLDFNSVGQKSDKNMSLK